MKRLVREVITLLRIERWLLDGGADDAREFNGDPQSDHQRELTTIQQIHLLPDGLSETEVVAYLATCPPPAGARVLAQRIIQVNQQERSQAGEVIDHS